RGRSGARQLPAGGPGGDDDHREGWGLGAVPPAPAEQPEAVDRLRPLHRHLHRRRPERHLRDPGEQRHQPVRREPARALPVPAGAVTDAAVPPGFYGKLPARGDFVSRRLGHAFIEAWDAWLQRAILASREALGGDWLDCYLTSPIWRFAAAAESCGPQAAAGIVMPSVDAVGRYFPLMLGRELPPGADLCAFAAGAPAWFEALEALALSTLDDGFQMESLDRPLPSGAVAGAPPPPAAAPLAPPGRHIAL